MTITVPKCRFCRFMCRFGRGAFAWQSGSVIIRHIGARSLKGDSDRGLLSPDEKLYGSITINYTEKLVGRIETWKQGGVAIFTDRQVILTKGFSCEYIHIPYSCIKELGKCNQGFFPIGMVITYENRESGEIVTEKISLGKRKKWLQIISEKTGL